MVQLNDNYIGAIPMHQLIINIIKMKYSDLTFKDKILCTLFIYGILFLSASIIGLVCGFIDLLFN